MIIMNKIIVVVVMVLVIASIIVVPTLTEQLADAKSRKKIHFTETITSSQDPGQDHETHQLALILSPNEGTLYDGSLTYTSSEPVQIVVLHEITSNQVSGQPTWTVDGSTVYGLSVINQGTSAGSFEFTGAALALHTTNTNSFTTTVSVDGWIRGQPTEIVMQKLETEKEEPSLSLSRANVPATIPMHMGLFGGESVYYIITDTNDQNHADMISEKQEWKVELAQTLSNTPNEVLQTVYMFTDGVQGDGIHGYQQEVFSSTPAQANEYNALQSVTHVSWKIGQVPEVLDSAQAIMDVDEAGRITLEQADVVINAFYAR